jgi:hypothetical protein
MDAIFAILLGSAAIPFIEEYWSSKSVCPIQVDEDPRGLLIFNI